MSQVSALAFLRSLSFSGLLFAGIAIIVYFSKPEYFSGINPYVFIGLAGLFGTSLQQFVSKAISLILGPIGRFISFYEKLLELYFLCHRGVLSEAQAEEIKHKLCEQRFINTKQLSS